MPQLDSHLPTTTVTAICQGLIQNGYAIIPNFVTQAELEQFYHYAQTLPTHLWRPAGIGREQQHTVNRQIRSDHIHWLKSEQMIENKWLQRMNALQQTLNQRLFLGLFDYECHLACYQAGSRYQKHLDAFKGRSNRVLSTVFYLNPEWQENDGGELVIYADNEQVLETILPRQGTFVIFLSDVFVHEVKQAHRTRYSITGWFRHNTSQTERIDPPA